MYEKQREVKIIELLMKMSEINLSGSIFLSKIQPPSLVREGINWHSKGFSPIT